MTLTTTHPLCPISGVPGFAFLSAGIRSIRAVPSPAVRRSDTDACPGALRLHTAADGPLARVRLPGGLLTGAQLRVVRSLAERWGDGHVELTSRANLQLRALVGATTADLAGPLRAAGLLPSDTHELVRNIAASPLHAREEVRALDRALCADPRLAELPGRFLFAFDAGHGDVYAGADVAVMPSGAVLLGGTDVGLRLSLTGTAPAGVAPTNVVTSVVAPIGVVSSGVAPSGVAPSGVVSAMIAVAHAFLDERAAQGSTAWRLAELDSGPQRVAARLTGSAPILGRSAPDSRARSGPAHTDPREAADRQDAPRPRDAADRQDAPRPRDAPDGQDAAEARTATRTGTLFTLVEPTTLPPNRPRPRVGIIPQPGGLVAAGAAVPLGRLDPSAMAVLAEAGQLIVTPWRGVLVADLHPARAGGWLRALAAAGLAVTADSRWAGVTACAGRPGCARSLADVRADAHAATTPGDAHAATTPGDGLPVHWVGCARGCGSPSGPHVRVEATGPQHYDVTAPRLRGRATTTDVGALVATARRS